MKATMTGGKDGATAPIGDGSGEWSAGLRHDGQAALVGTILAAMPHLDELVADLLADRLGADVRLVLAALERDDDARMALLRSLPGGEAALAGAVEDYAAARGLWRAYGGGLWYTHRSGRTYLAAPETGGAAFRVAREVKPADLRRARAQVDRLAASLAALVDAPARPGSRKRPRPRSGPRPPAESLTATPAAPAPKVAPAPISADEPARAKRVAPVRTTGARRRRAPVRPARAPGTTPPPAGTADGPGATE